MKKTVQQSICKVGIGEREGRRRKPLDRSYTKGLFFSVNPWIWLLNPMDSVCMATPKDDGNSIESLICHQGRKSYSTIFCKAFKNARFSSCTYSKHYHNCLIWFLYIDIYPDFFNSLIFWFKIFSRDVLKIMEMVLSFEFNKEKIFHILQGFAGPLKFICQRGSGRSWFDFLKRLPF